MARKAVKRAFKYRFYPTDAQAAELLRTFGCVRLVYNKALSARTTAWYQRQERVNYNATSAMLTNHWIQRAGARAAAVLAGRSEPAQLTPDDVDRVVERIITDAV